MREFRVRLLSASCLALDSATIPTRSIPPDSHSSQVDLRILPTLQARARKRAQDEGMGNGSLRK
jgi:hypothetical protein